MINLLPDAAYKVHVVLKMIIQCERNYSKLDVVFCIYDLLGFLCAACKGRYNSKTLDLCSYHPFSSYGISLVLLKILHQYCMHILKCFGCTYN